MVWSLALASVLIKALRCRYDVLELLSKFAVLDEEEVSLLVVNALLEESEKGVGCHRA